MRRKWCYRAYGFSIIIIIFIERGQQQQKTRREKKTRNWNWWDENVLTMFLIWDTENNTWNIHELLLEFSTKIRWNWLLSENREKKWKWTIECSNQLRRINQNFYFSSCFHNDKHICRNVPFVRTKISFFLNFLRNETISAYDFSVVIFMRPWTK